MASATLLPSLPSLFAIACLHLLCVSTVYGGSYSSRLRTRRSAGAYRESVLSSFHGDYSADHYLSSYVHAHDNDDYSRSSAWSRHKRAPVRSVNYRANPVPEDKKGLLFTVFSTVPDAILRRFAFNSTSVVSASSPMFRVDEFNGQVYLVNGSRLDYEDDEMNPLQITIRATKRVDPSDIVWITATLPLRDVNDENPVFRNAPFPYLATVAATAADGTEIYELYASDDDQNSTVEYQLVSVEPAKYLDRFQVITRPVDDRGYGVIYKGYLLTKGSGRYPDNREINVAVSARDLRGDKSQVTVITVKVLVGVRPPQFYEDPYRGYMMENSRIMHMVTQEDGKEMQIKVKKFQDGNIRFDLFDDAVQLSNVFTIDNSGRISNLQVLDYESVDRSQQPLRYNLVLKVYEDLETKTLTNNASLIITVQDKNDNEPVFEKSQYLCTVKENLPIGASVTEVTAQDYDSGVNAELVYSLDHEYFYVDTVSPDQFTYTGIIRVKKGLDFDRNPGHNYNMFVYASDKGSPRQSTSVQVRVSVTNVNDESPEFTSPKTEIDLYETAPVQTVIAIIQAVDLDGDAVTYYFTPKKTKHGAFRIDPNTGLITLAKSVRGGADFYPLNITAYDDGSCCPDSNLHSTKGSIIVRVVDINTHKPVFETCSDYSSAKVKEHSPIGSFVLRVRATDQDKGENGIVRYGITAPNDNTFTIGRDDGSIRVGRIIDRENPADKYIQVTVNATDGADPPLDGWCTFRVDVEDINDNKPQFERSEYLADVTSDTQTKQVILAVRADDADIGKNGEIEYSLLDDAGIFGIYPANGFIYLAEDLIGQTSYKLTVMAKDKGRPPQNSTATVSIKVAEGTSSPPTWDDDYDTKVYYVSETAVSSTIAKMKCFSNIADERVEFQIIGEDASSSQSTGTFAITYSGNEVTLYVDGKLDYETTSSYTVRLKCLNFGPVTLQQEVRPTIKLLDKNDELPYFGGTKRHGRYPGSVPENKPPGEYVITIVGYDNDMNKRFNTLSFSLDRPNENFEIRPGPNNTAEIYTKTMFNREEKSYYDLMVIAKDGAPSDRPGHRPAGTPNSARVTVEVFIMDQNDNPPRFPQKLYEFEVSEEQYINTEFGKVEADDPDETDKGRLAYHLLKEGNEPLYKFHVNTDTGGLFLAKTLDYESDDRLFELTLNASDGKHTASTKVRIKVLDANDNPPHFLDTPYRVENLIVEEDTSVIKKPKFLLRVEAEDKDIDRHSNITYSLQGYGTEPPNQYFTINQVTGEIFVIKPLDRDGPFGRANYQFTVVAKDEPHQPWQYGYATVEVLPTDINDNKPTFDPTKLQGSVAEHASKGTSVMIVLATDPDSGNNGSVVYEIIKNSVTVKSKQDYFVIERETGLIKTNVDMAELDREITPYFALGVRASDQGNPPLNTTDTITISLIDINDKIPVFSPKHYFTTMSENQKTEGIIRVVATDADMGNNAKLTYSLAEQDRKFFQIVTIDNMGSILVYGQGVDYEQPLQKFFNLTVIAEDPDPTHTATAYVAISVMDYNDNAPTFNPEALNKDIYEDEKPGYHVVTFNASDLDSGDNAKFEFSIDRRSDPRRHFSIHPLTGKVTLRKPLDRETQEKHVVKVRAIDKGDPQMTGYATLTVNVLDINDNFPQFKHNYQPQVREEDSVFPVVLQRILGKDPDASPFGPPFGFTLPPCQNGTFCEHFSLMFDPDDDGGNGTATVSTKSMFDREKQKYYYIPIIMWDMRGKYSSKAMTGTNTLTVTVADINDNKPYPGHQDIFVYNYKGMFGPLDIGRVYVEDLDDWDLEDKTFTFAEPAYLQDYFTVNKSTGMVTMKKGVPANTPDRPFYEFKVDVYDSEWRVGVRSTVKVTVRLLPEEAVANSGAIRVTGTTAEEFVVKKGSEMSKKEKFHTALAEVLGLPLENVDIITVMDIDDYTDIRYAAHGSPYYQASQVDSAVVRSQKKIEELVGIKILMVPISVCAEEQFEGGCYQFMNITGNPAMVNANGTSFVGVEVFIVATEGCRARAFPDPNYCTGDYCFNGGTCLTDDWGVLTCNCLPDFDGPRCQQTRHSFNGESLAFFPALEQCEESHTTIEFITEEPDGLLLYNGPIGEIDSLRQPEDFISLELIGGYPRLMINHGTGTATLSLNGRDQTGAVIMQQLSDGTWHKIDVIRRGMEVELIVDNCRSVQVEQDVQVDTSACSTKNRTPGENTFLNVDTLLQLGGRFADPTYPKGITEKKFKGCIRNLFHNSKLYDLYYKPTADFNSGFNGCPEEDELCGGGISGRTPLCQSNSKCSARWDLKDHTCTCEPGWRGPNCDIATTVRNLKAGSHFQWTLNREFFSSRVKPEELEIQMMFRTRDEEGVLFTASSTDNTQTITLDIFEGRVRVLYNLGDGEQQLQLSRPVVSDGQWHTVNAKRRFQQMTLTLDGGEGRNYNYSRGNPDGKVNLIIQRIIYAGASVSYSQDVRVLTGDLNETCVQDIRLNNGWFPMDFSENSYQDAVATLKENPSVEEGCVRVDCKGDPDECPGRLCYPLWERYVCRCFPGYHEVDGECVSDCVPNPCFKNVTCRIDDGQVMCVCPPDKIGEYCREPTRALTSSVTTPGIVAIIVSAFVVIFLLLLVFLLVKLPCRPEDNDKYILEVDPEDDIRENVINYDEEGAGEEDQDAYDISRLQKTDMDPLGVTFVPRRERPVRTPGDKPDVGDFITERMNEADNDLNAPPHDSVMEFEFEGAGSDAGSLSSLNTSNSADEADYDYLNEWGPKFTRLAEMYGASLEGEED